MSRKSASAGYLKYAQEHPSVYDENGNFVDWKAEFKRKEDYLKTYYEEEEPEQFIREVMPAEYLDSFRSTEEVLPLVAFLEGTGQDEGLHSGKGTGLLKWTYATKPNGEPLTRAMEVYSDYKSIMRVKNNRFALINLCTYFGRNIYRKGADGAYHRVSTRVPSECLGLAIDLDYVKLEQLQRLFGRMETGLMPYPTYLVNSGAGVHLYYLFEKPVPLKDIQVQRYLGELKEQLTEVVWTGETSLASHRQYQGIYQDMRCPGSWTKFGYKNKSRCKYTLKAYKVGERVDLRYLEEYVDADKLPEVKESGSLSEERLTLEECASRYPEWYERVVVRGEHSRKKYGQNRGLLDWWEKIIAQEKSPTGFESDKAHVGNRFFCMRVFFVMAKKTASVSLEEAWERAVKLLPFMNGMARSEAEAFTLEDLKEAATYYEDNYVLWSNETIEKQTGIRVKLYATTRRNGKSRAEHLEEARAIRDIRQRRKGTSWSDGAGRPAKSQQVREWREKHPEGTKYACIRETGLDKKTVYKWWEEEGSK